MPPNKLELDLGLDWLADVPNKEGRGSEVGGGGMQGLVKAPHVVLFIWCLVCFGRQAAVEKTWCSREWSISHKYRIYLTKPGIAQVFFSFVTKDAFVTKGGEKGRAGRGEREEGRGCVCDVAEAKEAYVMCIFVLSGWWVGGQFGFNFMPKQITSRLLRKHTGS